MRSGIRCLPSMEEREQLQRDLERYCYLLANIRDERAVAALRQLIQEIRDRLDSLECREGACR